MNDTRVNLNILNGVNIIIIWIQLIPEGCYITILK